MRWNADVRMIFSHRFLLLLISSPALPPMAVRSVCRAGRQLQYIRPAADRRPPRASGVASAWRVKHTGITTHHSTSCIQNLRRQPEHTSVVHSPCLFRCSAETISGHSIKHPLSSSSASGHCFKNTLCRVLRGCSRDHCSTFATVFSRRSMTLSHLSP